MIKKFIYFFGLLIFSTVLFAANAESPEIQLLLQRVSLLESALAPTTPAAVVKAWAEAAKNRNGAVQYMLLCPNLQKANLAQLKELNWVTGVSSPWISGYKILPTKITNKFAIQYQFSDGSKAIQQTSDYIEVKPINIPSNPTQHWCISKFSDLSPVNHL